MSSDAGKEGVKSGRELRLQPTVARQQPSEARRDREYFLSGGFGQRLGPAVAIAETCEQLAVEQES